jgi:serine/threonine protein kinase
LIRCYSINNRNLTSNKYIIYTKRFELEFEDIKQISSGSFGDVFIAKHKYDKAKYALKRIRIKNESE